MTWRQFFIFSLGAWLVFSDGRVEARSLWREPGAEGFYYKDKDLLPRALEQLEEEIAALRKRGGAPLQLRKGPRYGYPALERYSPSLQEAANEVIALMESYNNLRERASAQIRGEKGFDQSKVEAEALLTESRTDDAESFFAFGRKEGPAGVIGRLGGLEATYLWLALMKERRYSEAVGAALVIRNPQYPPNADLERLRREFLVLCGLDLPKLGAVMLAASEADYRVGNSHSNRLPLDVLEFAPGEREVAWLKEFMVIKGRSIQRDSVEILAEIAAPVDSTSSRSKRPEVLAPEALRRGILEFFLEKIGELSHDSCKSLVRQLAGAKRGETRPLLRILLNHSSTEVSKAALWTLNAMGETGEIRPLQRVKFQIFVDGMPLKGRDLKLDLNPSTSSSSRKEVKTNAEGAWEMDRSLFEDPGGVVTSMTVSNPGPQNRSDPPFTQRLLLPTEEAAWNGVQRLDIRTKPVIIELTFPPSLPEAEIGKVEITLRVMDSKHGGTDVTRSYHSAEKLKISGLQEKVHKITVSGWKLAHFESQFDVSQGDVFRFPLERGANLSFSVPSSTPLKRGFELERNGKPWSLPPSDRFDPPNTCRGLPTGDYVLRFEGGERSFRIDDQSPEKIDLGEIVPR